MASFIGVPMLQITKECLLVDVEFNQAFFFSPSTPIIKNISSKAGNPEHNPKIHQ